jgi:uncharacterized protein (DUF2384 family)
MTKQRVIDKAVGLFQSARIANSWMNISMKELDGKKPVELLETETGRIHLYKILENLEKSNPLD